MADAAGQQGNDRSEGPPTDDVLDADEAAVHKAKCAGIREMLSWLLSAQELR